MDQSMKRNSHAFSNITDMKKVLRNINNRKDDIFIESNRQVFSQYMPGGDECLKSGKLQNCLSD